MKATSEEIHNALSCFGSEQADVQGAVARFLNTAPDFYPSKDNLVKLFKGLAYISDGDYTDVQTLRNVHERLKANKALESESAPVVAAPADPIDADGFTPEERERAKARRTNRAERAIYKMSADEYRKQTPELGRKHAR
jgi:hypothetical protein